MNATPKSARTRAAIRDAAVRSFQENGYDATTIRSLATELGMSVGSAYYHFPSKSHLVQEMYVEVADDHHAKVTAALASERKLGPRLRIALHANLDQLEPYAAHAHEFVTAGIAADADASPLSAASAQARDTFVATFTDVVEGAAERVPDDIAALLPAALYRVNLLSSLAWVQDRSPGHERVRRLVDRATALIPLVLPALRLPPVRRAVRELLTDVAELGA